MRYMSFSQARAAQNPPNLASHAVHNLYRVPLNREMVPGAGPERASRSADESLALLAGRVRDDVGTGVVEA